MSLTIIKSKNSLKSFQVEGKMFMDIIAHVKNDFPNYNQLKHNLEFIEYVLQIIQNNSKANIELDISALAVKILCSFFQYTPDELAALQKQIEYLIDNGIIRNIPRLKAAYKGVKNYVLKKVIGV